MTESAFDSLVAEQVTPAVAALFGRAITYTPAVGAAVNLTALHIGPEREDQEVTEERGAAQRVVREVKISTDPDCDLGGVAAPAANATVTIDTVVWPIERVEMLSGGRARLVCARDPQTQRSRSGYRR